MCECEEYGEPHRKIYWDEHVIILEEDEINQAKVRLKEIKANYDGNEHYDHIEADQVLLDLLAEDEELVDLFNDIHKWYS
jgi:hypothetical protein